MRTAAVLFLYSTVAFAQDADARKAFESVCTQCHDLDRITERRATHDVWNTVVNRMKSEGASAAPAEFQRIVEYLARTFPPRRLNVNQASAADLAAFFALSDDDGRAIVRYREANGSFTDVAGLLKSGAPSAPIEARKDALDY